MLNAIVSNVSEVSSVSHRSASVLTERYLSINKVRINPSLLFLVTPSPGDHASPVTDPSLLRPGCHVQPATTTSDDNLGSNTCGTTFLSRTGSREPVLGLPECSMTTLARTQLAPPTTTRFRGPVAMKSGSCLLPTLQILQASFDTGRVRQGPFIGDLQTVGCHMAGRDTSVRTSLKWRGTSAIPPPVDRLRTSSFFLYQ